MLGRLRFLLAYYAAWILLFFLARTLFLLYQLPDSRQLPPRDLFLSFVYGLRMDLAMGAFLLLPIALIVAASAYAPSLRTARPYQAMTWLFLLPILLITLSDLEIYQSWGFRIDATPLQYLRSPREALASVSHLPLIPILLGFIVVYLVICWIFNRFIRRISRHLTTPEKPARALVVTLLFMLLLLIPARGGWQQTPLNQSSVYFSKNNFANVAALNASWNFLNGVVQTKALTNPYPYMAPAKAKALVDSLYNGHGQTQLVLNQQRPNVLLIIWESFTEKATHIKRDGKEVTPGFNALKQEGIYFSRMYASGDRTDKGLAALLSGYPAMNNFSVIRVPSKSAKLPTLSAEFKKKGYSNSFYYGGEPEFANIKSYLLQGQFDELTGKKDFRSRDWNSKWGAHDGVVADRVLEGLSKTRGPFFCSWLTLSSHEPFEEPVPPAFPGTDLETRFMNSLHYTDQVLFDFVNRCKQQPWWANTLLIIISDHGHTLLPPSTTLDNRRMAMLWLGGALKEKGMVYDKVCSQLDLATSLMTQVGDSTRTFPFSRNLFDSAYKPWAYFSFNNGFAMVWPDRAYAFDNVGKRTSVKLGPVTAADLEAGKALQQYTYQDYLDK